MIQKAVSLSKQYNECYPIAITEYTNSFHDEDQNAVFQFFEEERLRSLLDILTRTIHGVITRCSKVLELGPDMKMELPKSTLNKILKQLVNLGESEPYGVRGGTLVVMFCSSSSTHSNLAPVKIGKFPLDPQTVSTYELHLTIKSTNQLKLKVANILRRIQGKNGRLIVDDDYCLEKKKLYRSSYSALH